MIQYKNQVREKYRELSELTENERHRLLAAERRRILLTILSTSSPPMALQTLARKLAERDTTVSDVNDNIVDQMETILNRTHIPMMADMGIVESKPETNELDFAKSWSY